jgi:hypothetical protein
LQFETNLLPFLIAFILCDSSRLKIAEKKIADCASLNLKLLGSWVYVGAIRQLTDE